MFRKSPAMHASASSNFYSSCLPVRTERVITESVTDIVPVHSAPRASNVEAVVQSTWTDAFYHPDDFDRRLYEKLSDLDQMRYDLNCLYEYFFIIHAKHFKGSNLFKSILPPVVDSLIAKNRQVCLEQMEYACRGIVSLLAAQCEYLAGPLRDKALKKLVRESFHHLSDDLHQTMPSNMYRMHGKKFNREPYQNLDYFYYTDFIDQQCFDAQAGLTELYEYVLDIRAITKTPIFISYRNDGAGKGALFDHRTLQQITKRDTVILTDNKLEVLMLNLLQNAKFSLEHGVEIPGHKKRPLFLNELDALTLHEGLIIIPGLAELNPQKINPEKLAQIEIQNALRKNFEATVLTDSVGKRPVLAICGGLYRLLETFGAEVTPIKGHAGSMPHLDENGAVVGNQTAHAIFVLPGTRLAKLCSYVLDHDRVGVLDVTSVHHKAAKESTFSHGFLSKFRIVGRTAVYKQYTRQASLTGSVEAIELIGDRPSTIGVQFHPESAVGDSESEEKQRALIEGLAKEADAQRKQNADSKRASIFNEPYTIFRYLGADALEVTMRSLTDDSANEDEIAAIIDNASNLRKENTRSSVQAHNMTRFFQPGGSQQRTRVYRDIDGYPTLREDIVSGTWVTKSVTPDGRFGIAKLRRK